jgi:hypothetical protein
MDEWRQTLSWDNLVEFVPKELTEEPQEDDRSGEFKCKDFELQKKTVIVEWRFVHANLLVRLQKDLHARSH